MLAEQYSFQENLVMCNPYQIIVILPCCSIYELMQVVS